MHGAGQVFSLVLIPHLDIYICPFSISLELIYVDFDLMENFYIYNTYISSHKNWGIFVWNGPHDLKKNQHYL